jgi:hypothetical protein
MLKMVGKALLNLVMEKESSGGLEMRRNALAATILDSQIRELKKTVDRMLTPERREQIRKAESLIDLGANAPNTAESGARTMRRLRRELLDQAKAKAATKGRERKVEKTGGRAMAPEHREPLRQAKAMTVVENQAPNARAPGGRAVTPERQEILRQALAVQRAQSGIFDNLEEEDKEKLHAIAVKLLLPDNHDTDEAT